MLVVRLVQLLEVAGVRTDRLLADLFGLVSPELGTNENVEVRALTLSVQVALDERIVRVSADILMTWAAPVDEL